jgi:hypothetical protein
MSSGGPLLGEGGYFGRAGDYGPRGPYGPWPSCGCGSCLIILGGMFIVCGGLLSFLERMLRGY